MNLADTGQYMYQSLIPHDLLKANIILSSSSEFTPSAWAQRFSVWSWETTSLSICNFYYIPALNTPESGDQGCSRLNIWCVRHRDTINKMHTLIVSYRVSEWTKKAEDTNIYKSSAHSSPPKWWMGVITLTDVWDSSSRLVHIVSAFLMKFL